MKFSKSPIHWVLSALAMIVYFLFDSDTAFVLAATPFVDLAGGCPKMIKYAADLAKSNYAFRLGRQTGMLDFITDPSNGGVKMELNNAQVGKKFVKTKVHYKKRAKPCEILEDSSVPSICDDGTEPVELSVDVTISKQISTPIITFSNDNMVNICQDTEAFMKEYVDSYQRALREKADEYILSQGDAAVGRWRHQDGSTPAPIGGATNKRLLGTDTSTGTVVPLFANYMDILLDYQYNQLTGVPAIVGEGNLQKFMMLSKYSCCNAPGVAYDNAVATAGAAFYVDQAANRILGNNQVLVIAPNTLHLLWFNENRNINIQSNLMAHFTIQDPVYPGLAWDMDFRWDCAKQWHWQMSAWLDVFKLYQTDSFGTDTSPESACEDELAGLTGVAQYNIMST